MRLRALVTAVALVVLPWIKSPAQSFTFVPDDTALAATLGTEIVFNVTITNTSPQVLTLAIVRTLNELPLGWESSMCLSVCYPPTTDSILTTPEFGSSPLNPNESRPFSLHVYTATNNGTGRLRIVARNTRDILDQRILTFHAISIPVGVEEIREAPATVVLEQNHPNPFNPRTIIGFTIPASPAGGQVSGFVSLKVFDVLGKEVATLVNEELNPGNYEAAFDGQTLPSGVYFYRLQTTGFAKTRKLLLMK